MLHIDWDSIGDCRNWIQWAMSCGDEGNVA
jgi:hypothetical protein